MLGVGVGFVKEDRVGGVFGWGVVRGDGFVVGFY